MGEPLVLECQFLGNRRELRSSVVRKFLEELPGTGTKKLCSRHIYKVERTTSGHVIQLHRPAYRNKGIDFTIRCETIFFNNGNKLIRHMPRHIDLLNAFSSLKQRYGADYDIVNKGIQSVFLCQRLRHLRRLADMNSDPLVVGKEGCPADVAVLLTKWLFIEQDVTYWHNSGRAMFFEKLQSQGLVD